VIATKPRNLSESLCEGREHAKKDAGGPYQDTVNIFPGALFCYFSTVLSHWECDFVQLPAVCVSMGRLLLLLLF